MTTTRTYRALKELCMAFTMVILLTMTAAAQQTPRTTTEKVQGAPTVTTTVLNGVVDFVEGNNLVVRMSTGEVRLFVVPESRRFVIDGREASVHELKPGTKLTATITTTTTPVTERTTTIGMGTVWHVQGNNVIVTLPNGENKMYKVEDSYRFTVAGKPASVHDLRKGMKISAQKIVEEPTTVIASDTQVVGQAPRPVPLRTEVAQVPARPRAAPTTPARAQQEAAPAPTPEPAGAPLPETLPKTGSALPLAGLLGLLFIGVSFGARILRRL